MRVMDNELPLTAAEEDAELEQARASLKNLTREQRENKKAIARRLHDFRKTGGLGCISRLAKEAGVYESVIKQMMLAAPVPYETWRKVGRGLDKLAAYDKSDIVSSGIKKRAHR